MHALLFWWLPQSMCFHKSNTNFVDVEFGERLGAVAAHQQEALPNGRFRKLRLQVAHLLEFA